jgi:hypothetical protein
MNKSINKIKNIVSRFSHRVRAADYDDDRIKE